MASPSSATVTTVTEEPKTPIPVITEASAETESAPAALPSPPLTTSSKPASISIASAVPASLKSPAFPSELPRSPMSATFSLLPHTPGVASDGALKTPITPPVAYMDFLKNAIASPSDLKSPKFLPHHQPSGHVSAGPSSPMHPQHNPAKRYRASISGPSGGMPSPGLLGAHMQALAKANSNFNQTKAHVYTPTQSSALSSARSSTSSLASSLSSSLSSTDSEPVSRSSSGTSIEREPIAPESAKKVVRFAKPDDKTSDVKEVKEEEDDEDDEDEVMEEVDCTRKRSINKDGTVTIKQVVTTTVTFKPRMSLMPAPKGKRRRIE